jgi:Cdc6-like AAA superfamily ATPase
MLPPIPRIPEARELIDEEKYFVIRGPRQSGKTTSLQALTAELRDEGEYAAVYISCESASTRAEEAAPAEVRILSEIAAMAQATGLPEDCLPPGSPGQRRLERPGCSEGSPHGLGAARVPSCCSWTRSTRSMAMS